MDETEFDLPQLLRPVEPEAFFRDGWEKQPLASTARSRTTTAVCSRLRDVDAVIGLHPAQVPEPDDLKPAVPPAQTSSRAGLPTTSRPRRILPRHRGGPRGVYPGQDGHPDRHAAPLGAGRGPVPAAWKVLRLSGPHESVPDAAGGAGLRPPFRHARGLRPADRGDQALAVLRLGPRLPLAEETATFSRDQLGPPTQEVTLQPGDLLYMPRGHVHEAFTSDSAVAAPDRGRQGVSLGRPAAPGRGRRQPRDVRFRASLPPGLLTDGQAPASLDGTVPRVAPGPGRGCPCGRGRRSAGRSLPAAS